MTALNKQALREAAQEEIMLRSVSDTSDAWQDEASPEAVLALLDELETKEEQRANWFQMAQKLGEDLDAAEKRVAALESDIKSANERYENRSPTEWAYNQACAAIEKHRLRADTAEAQLSELVAAGIITKVGE